MNKPLTVMNFSNAYKQESFYQQMELNWIECSGLTGTNCYCDEDAQRELEELIDKISPEGVHFIDSGNYHYVSEFWMLKLEKDFNLILIDHHPDTKLPKFGDYLSCGGWVKQLQIINPHLKNVIMIDVDSKLILPEDREDHIIIYNKYQIIPGFMEKVDKLPVYISIDKDVLRDKEARTDWTQGNMTLWELTKILKLIYSENEVIGIDICGEKQGYEENAFLENANINNETNLKLLQLLEKM